MQSRPYAAVTFAGAMVAALTVSGCTPPARTASAPTHSVAQADVSEADRAALARLAEVAGPTSGVATERITATNCWLPSNHLLDDPSVSATTWKVLCRVDWTAEGGEARFQDTTCIGDFAAEPMLDRCYRWTHYDQMPAFDDEPSVRTG